MWDNSPIIPCKDHTLPAAFSCHKRAKGRLPSKGGGAGGEDSGNANPLLKGSLCCFFGMCFRETKHF